MYEIFKSPRTLRIVCLCTVQWFCELLQSVAKSRAEFYFVQHFAQQKNCETTHVILCHSPALRDKLLRKLHSVRGASISICVRKL